MEGHRHDAKPGKGNRTGDPPWGCTVPAGYHGPFANRAGGDTGRNRWGGRYRLQQRWLRDVWSAGGVDGRANAPDGQHQPAGHDPDDESLHPAFQRKKRRTVYQDDLDWRVDHRPVQLPVPRHEMGARGLEREHGVRTEPAWDRDEDRGAGRNEDRLLHALARCWPTSGV